ncbi:MAG: hypothetical protein PWP65_1259 [Clostridia bacterium]|nr:hypothetical protein [Clostridia bacterium]
MASLGDKGEIGGLKVKNRIVMAPMGTNLACADGSVSPEMVAYYSRRARGGAGLVIVESSAVDFPYGSGGAAQPRADEDRFVPGLSRLAEAIQNYGARAVVQLNHAGRNRSGGWAPSDMDESELELIAEKFALAALRAKEAGFDAVEIHAAHSYLLTRFLSRAYNSRDDKYGGSLENRLRFPLKVLQEVKRRVGSLPVLVRINGREFLDGGIDLEESKEIARAFEKAGASAIDVSCGPGKTRYSLEPWITPQGWRIPYAAAIKAAVSVPVIGVGCIREPDFAQKILSENKVDFVAVGRGMIADPDWANKALRGEKIRPCIGCNLGCVGRRVFGKSPIRCAVNPEAGRESEAGYGPAGKKKKVVVVGGGPAGMTAALAAGKRGHEVTLLEKSGRLGGKALLAALPPGKERIKQWVEYLEEEIKGSGIRVLLDAPESGYKSMDPEVLVLATGAGTLFPEAVVAKRDNPEIRILTGEECLANLEVAAGKRITVIGGGGVGCELALTVAERGAEVTVVEMLDDVAADLDPITRQALKEMMAEKRILLKTGSAFEDLEEKRVIASTKSGRESWEADVVVFCWGQRPSLPQETISGIGAEVYVIGDAAEPGNFLKATAQGYWVGRSL